MKRIIAIFIVFLVTISTLALAGTATTNEVTRPYEWVEYGDYTLNGKETTRLILVTMYEDISLDYKGWYPQVDDETYREIIVNDLYTSIAILDGEPTEGWQTTVRNIMIKIQGEVTDWVINNGVAKDYNEWLDWALICLSDPTGIFYPSVQPCFFCAVCWNVCYLLFL